MDLSDANIQAEVNAAMKHVFDTFARSNQITIYQLPENDILVVDPNYNSDFGTTSPYETSVSQAVRSQSFTARVWYENIQALPVIVGDGNEVLQHVTQVATKVTIQLEEDGYSYMQNANRIFYEGMKYKIEGDVKKLGILHTYQTYQFTLVKAD